MRGYSYTVIRKHADDDARVRVALHLDEQAQIKHYSRTEGESDLSFVTVEHCGVDLTIDVAGHSKHGVTAGELAAVRKLAEALNAYVADLEAMPEGEQAA